VVVGSGMGHRNVGIAHALQPRRIAFEAERHAEVLILRVVGDADFTVLRLLMGVFGTRRWMASKMARLAGRTRSPAKTAAAPANGRKGGRPRRRAAA
jgi:hypothetical protein